MCDDPIFLTGHTILERVRWLLGRQEPINLAVAFWGAGAIDRIGLRERHANAGERRTRIICDLMSGACNPGEIRQIRAMQPTGVEVRTLDGLHAKVYSTTCHSIIGSANVSANGLGDIAVNLTSNLEAAVFSQNSLLANQLEEWFNGHWRNAGIISDEMLNEAEILWGARRSTPRRWTAPAAGQLIPPPNPWFDQELLGNIEYLRSITRAVGVLQSADRSNFFFTAIGARGQQNNAGERLDQHNNSEIQVYHELRTWRYVALVPFEDINGPEITSRATALFNELLLITDTFVQVERRRLLQSQVDVDVNHAIRLIQQTCVDLF